MKHIICCLSLLSYYSSFSQNDSLLNVEFLSDISVYLYQPISDTSGSVGTGTIISHKDRFYLLTAEHVSKSMNEKSTISFRLNGNKAGTLNLIELATNHKLNWKSHPIADISILEIEGTNDDVKRRLKIWSLPSRLIQKDKELAPIENELIYFGYPFGNPDVEYFSPVIFDSHRSSGLMTLSRADPPHKKCAFYFLNKPSMQGASGSGVYYSVHKTIYYLLSNKTLLVGIIHGTQQDNTGGKLAFITPSFYIWDLLEN